MADEVAIIARLDGSQAEVGCNALILRVVVPVVFFVAVAVAGRVIRAKLTKAPLDADVVCVRFDHRAFAGRRIIHAEIHVLEFVKRVIPVSHRCLAGVDVAISIGVALDVEIEILVKRSILRVKLEVGQVHAQPGVIRDRVDADHV